MQATFRFKPFSQKQRRVLNWWCEGSPVRDFDGIIADGAIRSGKTVPMSLSFGLWAMENFNGQNFIMAGKTVGSFRRNVLRFWKGMMASRGFRVEEKRSDNLVVVSSGPVTNYFYVFGGKDEASQDIVQGITAAGALFDEVVLMPESFVNQATARCSVDGSKFWFTCNPGTPLHWFRTGWIGDREAKRLLYLHFTMEDNASLSERIKERYRGQYSGVFYQRYIEGLWVSADGLIYDMFDKNKHVVEAVPPTEGPYYVSADYGIQNANVWLLWRKVAGKNQYICLGESYYSGRDSHRQKTDGELLELLKTLLGGRNPECIIIDPSAASMISLLRRAGYTVRKARNEVREGIADVSTMLTQGRLLFASSCEKTLEEFGLYLWDEKASQRGEDAPIKQHDHAMDAVRYFVKTMQLERRLDAAPYSSPFF